MPHLVNRNWSAIHRIFSYFSFSLSALIFGLLKTEKPHEFQLINCITRCMDEQTASYPSCSLRAGFVARLGKFSKNRRGNNNYCWKSCHCWCSGLFTRRWLPSKTIKWDSQSLNWRNIKKSLEINLDIIISSAMRFFSQTTNFS